MEALECDVACPVALVPFAFADKRDTLRDVADDGRLNFDGLIITTLALVILSEYKKKVTSTVSASTSAASHCFKRTRTRARLAST